MEITDILHCDTIVHATNHFSHSNKVGNDGSGSVYKAVLPTGEVLAVKRVSGSPYSEQGSSVARNEILLLQNLQHENIIKLFGFGYDAGKHLLLYEFMENGSLDTYLGHTRRKCLDWQVRLKIITGIAQAILYLHRDSGRRIIYRELKPGTILLDREMNPKLSKFVFAKSLADDQSEPQTSGIIGTFGYLPPEYFMLGKLSTKLDVFSFGIVVLEIVSGRRSIISYDQESSMFLPDHAWELWKEGRTFDLIDRSLQDTFPLAEALRCIQIGLLCTQMEPHDRPNMHRVIKMLKGDEPLVEPKERWSLSAEGYPSSNSVHIGGTSYLDDPLGSGKTVKSRNRSISLA